jgi:hypothetical protein
LFKLDLVQSTGNPPEFNRDNMLNKVALEIGTGYFLVQPIILKLLGWEKIVTVDISHDIFSQALKKQINLLLQDKYLLKIKALSVLHEKQFDSMVNQLKKSTSLNEVLNICNITYIAPYTVEDLRKCGFKFDFIFSQVVLEHIPVDTLKDLFSCTKLLLKKEGRIVHIVNFTDHFTNPGIWGDKNISEFNFLKYSDKTWNFWAGNSIAYTNRLGYPYYYELCAENDLNVLNFVEQNYKKRKFFSIDMIHQDVISQYNHVNINDLIKVQRGAFIIGHNE